MNIWETAIITEKGLALQSKLHSGTTLSLTRAVVGAGTADVSTLASLTSVVDERQEMKFSTQSYPEEGKCAVPLKLYNTDVEDGFTATQIGVYAFDPDEGEILYLIAQAINCEGTAVPSATEMPGYLSVWTFYIQYGMADSVEVTVDPAGSMTAAEVEEIVAAHANSKNNPHGVTAEQLGLDKVDNTPDTEKHVAYAQRAGSADKAKYGLTIRFNGGRTENTDQWTYDGSTSRTVNITPEKIGASPSDHSHTLSDLGAAPTKHSHTKADISDFAHTHYYNEVVTTGGTSEVYTATVEGITELKPGISFIMIPHVSNAMSAKLNVNSLGGKTLAIPHASTYDKHTFILKDFLPTRRPVKVTYNGDYWVVDRQIAAPAYSYGTNDLTPGSSTLETGTLYFVYE